ncbi:Endo-1,4-beta-xylanase, GH35 family [Eubacterium ruminantium]|uniref:Beta-xylanase n=1 Tax=Eubacterium ruminantium TaxID=42322 RepID=A0A1T4NTW7_9FIRM|nr:endo-1,4-beta-xylanase [Eubacterium ruminantium]SCW55573.1 Endo-1,4-beta-xylanase, GH35 family [Eubacterium ruminantium]SDN03086.1 Endo-1,4-beta-xylanase, GH35 family [Eubacterium ruminantium]SJZ82567.1 Endo-1,4-beta-xylanase, GH35 family [Eubacterium ruminantium]
MKDSANISHRKAREVIRVFNADGTPAAGKKIKVKQTRHSFLFGCGSFDFIPYVMNKDEEHKELVDTWQEIFNYGTLPFYWGQYEPEEGKPNFEALMATAKFMKSQGITVKGHPLCWHTVCADWLMKYDNETILKKQLERIDREVTSYKGVIDMWDVINEVVIMPIFDKYDNAVTRICKDKGRVKLIKTVFDEAYKMNPDAVLLLNDFNTSISYEILIDGCLEAGVPISAIGIQSHQHQGYWGAKKVYEVLERFSHFGLPIHFTENTLISGDIIPAYIEDLNDWQVEDWPTTPEGEERQAREIEEMYRILFENPLVQAITTWDYRDGAWLGAPSGFVRKDNSKKPSFEMLKKLTHEEWWTDTEITTDDNGVAEVDVFKGDYKLIVDDHEEAATFVEAGKKEIRL